MINNNILTSNDFMFAPYNPGIGIDSGALYLATSKTNPQIQYVIKSEYPELACNEFMYHKVAESVGLHMQAVKLFQGIKEKEYATGIRFSPNARKFDHKTATEENIRDFYAFHSLYVILNEEDSQEFYIDEQERVFKLDNAASFNMSSTIAISLAADKKKINSNVKALIQSSLNYIEYNKYRLMMELLIKNYGQESRSAYLEMFERFVEFDESVLDEAYGSLDIIYPNWLSDYYCEFIYIRKAECRRFLREVGGL